MGSQFEQESLRNKNILSDSFTRICPSIVICIKSKLFVNNLFLFRTLYKYIYNTLLYIIPYI